MEASTLNCPMCGASSASDATQCEHCGARLATVACPSCFGMIFLGSKFCQHCGGKIGRIEETETARRQCPRCKLDLAAVLLGSTKVHECQKCEGLWVDVDTLNAICADREKQAAVIGGASPAPGPVVLEYGLADVRYVPCPACGTLMNRVNFSGHSGVIVDVCKGHGTWFDRDELRRIVEFIRAGGLDAARDRDRAQWESEKRLRNFAPPAGGGASIPADPLPVEWRTASNVVEAVAIVGAALVKLLMK